MASKTSGASTPALRPSPLTGHPARNRERQPADPTLIANCPRLLALILVLTSLAGASETSATRKEDVLWDKLAQTIAVEDKHLDGVLGVAIVDLKTGREWTLHGDDVFPTASTIKLALLAELYRQHEQALAGKPGNARLTDTYTVRKEDIVVDSAVMENLTPGVTLVTNRDLAGMVVAVSDNSATNVLIDRVSFARVNQLLDSLGASDTRLQRKMMDLNAAREGRENIATPRQIAKLLAAAYQGKLFGPELTKDFFTLLSTTKDSWMPRLIPEGVKIANKPGSLAGVRNDAGVILVPNRPFVIAIMTTYDRDEHQAEEIISRISLAAFHMFDTLANSSEYGRQITERNSH
jgi:beta-lactamase class A